MNNLILLSIIMPCLNEEETLQLCISKSIAYINNSRCMAEVIVADNGSTDKSVEISESLGVRVIHVANKGYGSALRAGIEAASGKYIIMGDADDSYDFSDVGAFIEKLEEGYDLVMGN